MNVAIGIDAFNIIAVGHNNIAIGNIALGINAFNKYKYNKNDKLFIISSKTKNDITTFLIINLEFGNITSIACIPESYDIYYTGPYDNVSQIKHIIKYYKKEHSKWLKMYLWMKQNDELIDIFAYMVQYYIQLFYLSIHKF